MGNAGGLVQNNTYSPTNLGGQRRVGRRQTLAQTQAQSLAQIQAQRASQYNNTPYAGGLQTDFTATAPGQINGTKGDRVFGGGGGKTTEYNYNTGAGATSPDADVRGAQNAWNQVNHPSSDVGVSAGEQLALYNQYLTRIGIKNSMSEEINAAPGQLNQAQDQNKLTAGAALGEGLKSTRQNYNSRGLLYSGAREGAEQGVQRAGGQQLARAMAGTAQDSANSENAAKAAYAAADMANQQDTLNKANQAFDTANQNNIARLQAFQQLGSGLGEAAGTLSAHYNNAPNGLTIWL